MKRIKYKFVDVIPSAIEDDVLYISTEYKTTIHKCMCGCGNEVALPLSPRDWNLTFNGNSVSLSPSIGSWSLPCQSHYWIKNNEIVWARQWSRNEIRKARLFDDSKVSKDFDLEREDPVLEKTKNSRYKKILKRIKKWF